MLLDLIICAACMYTGFLQGTGLGIIKDPLGLDYNWARYLEWAITNPCMLSIISRMSGAPMDNNFVAITFCVVMVACGASAQAIDDTPFMWVFFGAGVLCLSVIFTEIIFNIRRRNAIKSAYQKRLNVLIGCTMVSWILYPTSWALQFSRAIPIRNEIFLVLNVAIKAVFSIILVLDTVRHQKEIFQIASLRSSPRQAAPRKNRPASLNQQKMLAESDDNAVFSILGDAGGMGPPGKPPTLPLDTNPFPGTYLGSSLSPIADAWVEGDEVVQPSPHAVAKAMLQQQHSNEAMHGLDRYMAPDIPSPRTSVAHLHPERRFSPRHIPVLEEMT